MFMPDGVAAIAPELAMPLILNVHYARRSPSISYAFGLYKNGEVVGIVTYGTPPSSTLRNGLIGKEMAGRVLELNRLCLMNNEPNVASNLVGKSLKMLPRPTAIVSFADTAHGHFGYVYQATNFIYCGLSANRTDWKIRGEEHLHGQTISDRFRGVKNRAQAMRDEYGDRFYLLLRSRKHRYVYFNGSKKERKEMLAALKYPILSYPKPEART
jgi:hypothetical protein